MRLSFTILFLTVGLLYAFSQDISIGGFVHDAENESYLQRDTLVHLHLQPSTILLQEVTVNAERASFNGVVSSLPVTEISKNYLLKNSSTNFIQTLSSIAGISSMDIGAGFSKPVIRGFGFNRVAVVDKGVVQQNQQWGADHGLEIDQYDVDGVRVHKGPMSLFYGSDAIGGVIEILPPVIPFEDMFWGDATIIAKSNNDLMGASVAASVKRGNLFLRGRATVQSYADYRVPVDTIEYLTWRLPVHNGRMKNTAGREINLALSGNYTKDNFSSWLHLSNINSKNGFYPGAHGIPSLERVTHDGSFRNIEMPYATSNHFKLIWNSELKLGDNDKLMFDVGYQQNKREELSAFHTHYGNQDAPVVRPDVELQFKLNTLSANARYVMGECERWSRTLGGSMEYQHNRVGGYSFLLPDFDRLSGGLFWINSVRLNDKVLLTGGLRYDMGRLNVSEFYDPLLADYLVLQGYTQENVEFYAMRSANLNRVFGDLSGSVGVEYRPANLHSLKLNVGRSFRYPGANELSSNGLHHGAFRHEQGNGDLRSEKGYQLDIDYQYENGGINVRLNPFVSWFENYIYLEPTGSWSVLPHAGQIYRYNEAEALVTGGELMVGYEISRRWSVNMDIEYVFNRNITDNYALPFTPPAVVTTDITYTSDRKDRSLISNYEFKLENRLVMDQTSVARNEAATPGAALWDISAYAHWHIDGRMFITLLQVDNIFNTSFMNHLSFYRKLNAPEPGRNIQLIVKIPF